MSLTLNQLLAIYQGVHITYFKSVIFLNIATSHSGSLILFGSNCMQHVFIFIYISGNRNSFSYIVVVADPHFLIFLTMSCPQTVFTI